MNKYLKYLIYIVLFVVGVYLITKYVGDFSTSVQFGRTDSVTISGPEKTSVTVRYSDIESLELITVTDPGEVTDGGSGRRYYWGTWKNDAYGEYTMFVTKKASKAILIRTVSGKIIVFNQDDDVTTENMYSMFTELLAHLSD